MVQWWHWLNNWPAKNTNWNRKGGNRRRKEEKAEDEEEAEEEEEEEEAEEEKKRKTFEEFDWFGLFVDELAATMRIKMPAMRIAQGKLICIFMNN